MKIELTDGKNRAWLDQDSKTIEIELTRGQVAIIDAEDWNKVKGFRWVALTDKSHKGFRCNAGFWWDNGFEQKFFIHRIILGLDKVNLEIDHIDHNNLNNRKSNLRLCSRVENSRNQDKTRRNTSGFKGVSWSKESKRWRVYIKNHGKQIHIGYFTDILKAAEAYNKKAKELFGEFAYLNKIPNNEQVNI